MILPIVGTHFHPPAQEMLQCLPSGTTIVLVPEPTNPYDENAIRVYVDLTQDFNDDTNVDVISDRLTSACEGRGMTGPELLTETSPCFLGFLPKSGAKTAEGGPGNVEVRAAYHEALASGGLVGELCFTASGKPAVDLTNAKPLDESCGEWAERRPFNE